MLRLMVMRRLGAALILVLSISACGDATTAPDAAPSSADASVSPSPSGAPSSPSAAPAAPERTTEAASGLDAAPTEVPAEPVVSEHEGLVYLVDMRLARQDGFDRVVWEYAGDGTPGWFVQYTDDPRQDPSIEPVELAGDVALEVFVRSVSWIEGEDDPVPVPYPGQTRLAAPGDGAVREVALTSTFEADQQAFLGLDSRRPYRITLLRDPTRVVVDVAH